MATDRRKDIKDIQERYARGENVISFLKGADSSAANSTDTIEISYDLQAGSYIDFAKSNEHLIDSYVSAIAKTLNALPGNPTSVLEAGVGEATTLSALIPKLASAATTAGFDLSWSRIKYAQAYSKNLGVDPFLFVGDLFHIPLADNAVDVVYTSHTIEPNGGREREALTELLRVTRKYLVLLEPAYEFATEEGKERMKRHGYITGLHETALSLGCTVVEYRPFEVSINPLNPTGLLVIEKEEEGKSSESFALACPITGAPLELARGSYVSRDGMYAYPLVDGIACLRPQHGVLATHYF